MTEPFQPTMQSVAEETGQHAPMRQQYVEWLSQTIAERFDPANSGKYFAHYLDFFGNRVTYDGLDQGYIEELIGNIYGKFVPEELRPDFRGAVVDVLSARLSDPEPKLDEVKSLVFISGGFVISPEAVVPISEALINNEAIRSDPDLKARMYQAVCELNSQKYVLDHMDDANAALQRLADSPEFDERWIYAAFDAVLRNNPTSASDALAKYGGRILAFKRDELVDERSLSWYEMVSKYLIGHLGRSGVELTPEQLAILKV